MNVTFFGQYLLDLDLISQEQLDEATAFQKENNALLGALALKTGVLTKEQVAELLHEQHHSYLKFGELALKKEYLDGKEVRQLLSLQGQNHMYLGEALTRRDYLSVRELNRQLSLFDKEIQKQSSALHSVLGSLDRRGIFSCMYEISREYLYRLGYAARVQAVNTVLPSSDYGTIFISLTAGDATYYFGLYLSDVLLEQIVYAKQPVTDAVSLEILHKEAGKIFYNLNLIICEEMQRKGISLQAGSLCTQPPEDVSRWTVLQTETLLDTFYMVFGRAGH